MSESPNSEKLHSGNSGESKPGSVSISVSDQAVADEIRIVQSIQVINYSPALLLGNFYPILGFCYLTWPAPVEGKAIWSFLVTLMLLVPMAVSYLKLRGRPKPPRVSRRRTRSVVIYSGILGLSWAISIVLLFNATEGADSALMTAVCVILIIGSVALLPSMPIASVAYSIPIAAVSIYGVLVSGMMSIAWLSIMCMGTFGVMGLSMRQNWHDLNRSVRLQLENREARRVTEEGKEVIERVSGQLSKYISPQLYEAILAGKQQAGITSQRKKLTVFFSDIAGFTDLTESLQPEEITTLLNEYLTEMLEIAKEYGAYFDKFIGDSIVLYFGEPASLGVKQDARACVKMAVAMQQRMHELQSEWRGMGIEKPFQIRIGINTGYCTVGNFGSEDRMDHTIIGSEVNLASRLEYESEVGGILLANETWAMVNDEIMAEEAETLTVQGFSRPIKTYRVKGIYDDLSAEGKIIHHQDEGLRLTIDHEQMDTEGKNRAAGVLQDALDTLKDQS